MAWSAPRTWVVSEIVTAAVMNTHVRDNLKYLKGQAGSIYLEDKVGILTSSPTGALSVGANNEIYISSTDPNTLNSAGNSNVDTGNLWLNYRGYADGFTRFRDLNIGNGKGVQIGAFKGATGYVGLGTGAPAGPLHVDSANGGMLFLAGVVSGSLNTLAVAGTVTTFMSCYISDYNAGTATVVHTFVDLKVSSSITYANTDTITVAVTAGGAITFQRTAGSNNHNVLVHVLYV